MGISIPLGAQLALLSIQLGQKISRLSYPPNLKTIALVSIGKGQ